MPEAKDDRVTKEDILGTDIQIRDHLERDSEDECGYCGQVFGPDEIVIERILHGRKWRFCSEECYRDFKDAADFRDEDLDGREPTPEDGFEEDEGEF